MILIHKSPAPPALEALKKEAEKQGLSDKEGYDLLRNPLKKQVREALMQEQGHLCAYCMHRIPDERILQEDTDLSDAYLEHWQSRSSARGTGENKGLDYQNLLAVCSGNEKAPGATGRRKSRHLTCDKKRGNAPLTVDPLDAATLATISYTSDGKIRSSDPIIHDDLNIRLNLNCSEEAVTLPENRKAVLDTIQEQVFQEEDLLQACMDQLHIWENETDPKTPYIGIVIWWLREQIHALQAGLP